MVKAIEDRFQVKYYATKPAIRVPNSTVGEVLELLAKGSSNPQQENIEAEAQIQSSA